MNTVIARETLLRCVHCGLCLQACPTYRVLGREADSPRGRIYLMRALEEGRLMPEPAVLEHLDLCLNCRACETACPAGVSYGDLIERTRARLHEAGATGVLGRAEEWILRTVFRSLERIAFTATALGWLQRLGLVRIASRGFLRRVLPPALRAGAEILPWVPSPEERALPAGVHAPLVAKGQRPRARVGLFATCVVQQLYPQVNRALLHLLRVAGCEVVVPGDQGCCGSLHAHAGYREAARAQSRDVLAAFPEGLDAVVTASAGCGATLKEYGHLFDDAGARAKERVRARGFAATVRDALEYLDELGLEVPWAAVVERVTMHDPCHLSHAQRVRAAPRRLLARIPGLELVEMAHSDWCCGSAGTYNLKHPEIARRLLDEKLDTVEAVSPTVVAVANPGCLLQMAAGGAARGQTARYLHPLELLARAYPWPRPAHTGGG